MESNNLRGPFMIGYYFFMHVKPFQGGVQPGWDCCILFEHSCMRNGFHRRQSTFLISAENYFPFLAKASKGRISNNLFAFKRRVLRKDARSRNCGSWRLRVRFF